MFWVQTSGFGLRMLIYLPIAEMTVHAEAILLLGAAVGFLSGVFGVGGGFLTTPLLIFMGMPPDVAVGTQANQLVAVSTNGMLSHWRKGNVDVKLALVMFSGSLAGTFAGILLFRMIQYFGQSDLIIPILYIILLSTMGTLMLSESVMAAMKKTKKEGRARLRHHPFFQALPYKMRFPRSRLYVSAFLPAGIGFVGGILVSVLGVGGGFILVPAMIYLLGMPPLLVAGTSMFQILLTSIIATIAHAFTSHTVDLMLAAILIAGGVAGAQAGVKVARRIKSVYARILLALMLLIVSFQLAGTLLIKPDDVYSVSVAL